MKFYPKHTLLLIVLQFAFSSIFTQDLYKFFNEDTRKLGVRDAEWRVIVPAIYDDIEPNLERIFAAKKDGKMLLFNNDGSVRVPPIYQHILAHFNNFHEQYGYAGVSKNDKIRNSWGIIDSKGKIILEEKYRYVRAINPDLLVGLVDMDSMLQFFNAKGKFLYKIAGRYVEPLDIDNTCFGVEGHDRKTRFYKSDGTFVDPKNPHLEMWTDGERTIVRKIPNETEPYGMGMVDKKGNVIIPLEFGDIRHGLKGGFIVKKRNTDWRLEFGAVYDPQGKTVIPLDSHRIAVFGDIYLTNGISTDLVGAYLADGKSILPQKYRQSRLHISESDYGKNIPNSHPKNYVQLQDVENKTSFLLRNDGKIIRTEGSVNISYLSDNHPIIVSMAPDTEGGMPTYKIADLEGNIISNEQYSYLRWTGHPRILIGSKVMAETKSYGFIYMDEPEKTQFNIERPNRMYNGYYRVVSGRKYKIYSPKIELIHEAEFNWCSDPDKNQYEQFHATYPTAGHLIAAGFRAGMTYGDWIGINDAGKEFLFATEEKPTPSPSIDEVIVYQEAFDEIPNEEAKKETVEITNVPEEIMEEEATFPKEETKSVEPSDKVHTWVRQPPQFPHSGMPHLINFIAKNKLYPPLAMENAIQGTVVVTFIVEIDGSLSDMKIQKSVGGGCDEEAIRLVKSMPKWVPGRTAENEVVRVLYSLPVEFKLN